jgi:hypothetical protein
MIEFKPPRLATGCLVCLLLLSGCVTSTVQQVRESATGMNETESVVVLSRKTRPSQDETEDQFVKCISKNMSGGKHKLHVVAEQEFRDAMFPWFEPRTAPVNAADLPELIAQPELADRLESLGLRYLIWVQGDTDRTDSSGSLTCSVTATGAGCFGFLTWEMDAGYEAQVWDVRSGNLAGRVSSEAVGTSYMPAVVVPLPFIAPVRSSACSSLAQQLKSFVLNEG